MNTSTQPSSAQISAAVADRYWRATLARDTRADGTFILGVRSTRIYCRPSCPARRPLRRNVVFFRTGQEAEKQGFRPCLRCKPNEKPATLMLVERAARELSKSNDADLEAPDHAGNRPVALLAKKLGVAPSALRRAFQQVTGLAPRDLADALRLKRFKALLRAGKNITDALYETGYGSSSRIYERSDAQLGMTPAAYQKGGKGMKLDYTIAKSPMGKVLVAATERGVSAVYLGGAEASLLAELRDEYPRAELRPRANPTSNGCSEIVRQIEGRPAGFGSPAGRPRHRFSASRVAGVAADSAGHHAHVHPGGAVVGQPKAVRAVARACATNPVSIVVPCHRVIRGDGNLAGYRWGISRKEQLLEAERAASK